MSLRLEDRHAVDAALARFDLDRAVGDKSFRQHDLLSPSRKAVPLSLARGGETANRSLDHQDRTIEHLGTGGGLADVGGDPIAIARPSSDDPPDEPQRNEADADQDE